jgi:hypothetical protein
MQPSEGTKSTTTIFRLSQDYDPTQPFIRASASARVAWP